MKAAHKLWFLFYVAFLRLRHRKRVIVFERQTGLGDVLCAIPAYRAVKQKFAEHLVIFATAQSLAPLLKLCAGIDVVWGIPRGMAIPKEKTAGLVDRHFEPHTSDERKQGGQKMHLARVFLKDCGLPLTDWQPRIAIPAAAQAAVAGRFDFRPGEPLIAIHTGRTWPVKELPEQTWQAIVNALRERFAGRIVHFCSPSPWAGEPLPLHQLAGVLRLPGDLDVIQTAAILSQCRLLIGIDSGLLHLAGALGIPVAGLFGPTNPEYFLPATPLSRGVFKSLPCSFCHHENPIKHWDTGCPNDIQCMKEITSGQVIKAVEEILSLNAETTSSTTDLNLPAQN